MSEDRPTVLVVEDEPELADLYVEWLKGDYDIRTAYGGEKALEVIDEDVDIVLLDRRMPTLSGDEVLDAIREDGIECRVSMVTAVEPDLDIVEMRFDDYLVKPVSREALQETVSSLLLRSEYDEGMQELFPLASKKALLESERDSAELEDNKEYQQLTDRIQTLHEELDRKLDQLDDTDEMAALYAELDSGFGMGEFESGGN
jgi:DNA-binding response OmpR family regulator